LTNHTPPTTFNPYGVTVKVLELAVPPTLVTVIFPVLAPVGTVALTLLSEFTVNVAAFTPPKLTYVVCVRPVPPIVTTVPIGPLVGAMLLIVGITLNCWLMLWPRLGRAFRTAPVSRQTNPNRVWHSPRSHSRPATLLRPSFCPFHQCRLVFSRCALVKKNTSRYRQKGGVGERFQCYVRFAIPMKISFDSMRRSLPSGSIP
jgi:hypothetical protein